MTENRDNGNPVPGGSGTGRNVPVQAQNVVIDANAQAAAAQMAQQILANTNVTYKQELVKIPDFWGREGQRYCNAYAIYGKNRRMSNRQRLK